MIKGIEITDSIFLVGEVDAELLGIGMLEDREGREAMVAAEQNTENKDEARGKYYEDPLKEGFV